MIGKITLSSLAVLAIGVLLASPAAEAESDLSGMWWVKDRSETIKLSSHETIPFLPAALEDYKRNKAAVAAGKLVPIGQGACMPDGVPRLMLARYPFQILQRPEQVTFVHEKQHMLRLIYMDKPMPEDFDPAYDGYSEGHWDGDTLVVDTKAFKPNTVLDKTGIPHSDALHVIERFALREGGKTLRDDVTVEDPKTFSKPWSFAIAFAKHPEVRLMEYVCTYGPPARDLAKK